MWFGIHVKNVVDSSARIRQRAVLSNLTYGKACIQHCIYKMQKKKKQQIRFIYPKEIQFVFISIGMSFSLLQMRCSHIIQPGIYLLIGCGCCEQYVGVIKSINFWAFLKINLNFAKFCFSQTLNITVEPNKFLSQLSVGRGAMFNDTRQGWIGSVIDIGSHGGDTSAQTDVRATVTGSHRPSVQLSQQHIY